MGKMNRLNDTIEVINSFINLSFKLGVALGGAVFIFYCWRIGYFPQDASVGDGLLLILLAIAFGGFYLFFIVCLTSLGIVLGPVWCGLQKLFSLLLIICKKITKKNIKHHPFTIEKARIEFWFFAMLGIFFVIWFSRFDIKILLTLTLCVWGCALMWSTYQQNYRDIFILEHKETPTDDDIKRLKNLNSAQPFIVVIFLILPLLVGGVTGELLDGTMRLANLRKDAAVVHIKEPYVTYAVEYGLTGEKSNFGGEYSKFSNVAILFNGFGRNVVIEMKKPIGTVSLAIPSDHVYIIQK
ncbi:hypothetical protein [Cedecea colo]|nr:hypothetical protein [Cedecea colo]